MNRQVNAISGRLSLRAPQRHSLEILDHVTEIVPPHKATDLKAALEVIRSEYPTVTDFEREFSIALFRTSYRRWQNAIDGRFYQLSASGTRHQ